MSLELYRKFLKETEREAAGIISEDRQTWLLKKIKKPAESFRVVAKLYARYIRLVNRLIEIYDQMVHPQKRVYVLRLLEMSIGRVLELKHEMVNIETDEFNYLDDVLIELKMVPFDVECIDPEFFRRDRDQELRKRNSVMKDIRDKQAAEAEAARVAAEEAAAPPAVEEVDEASELSEHDPQQPQRHQQKKKPEMSPETREQLRRDAVAAARDAVTELRVRVLGYWPHEIRDAPLRLIQRHERFRQSRVRLLNLLQERHREQLEDLGDVKKIDKKVQEHAARTIQKHWRIYREKLRMERRDEDDMLLLCMATPSWLDQDPFETLEVAKGAHRDLQRKRRDELARAEAAERTSFWKRRAPWIMDDMADELRPWFRLWYDKAHVFPEYPTEEEGGSWLIIQNKVMTPGEYLEKQEEIKKYKALTPEQKKKIKEEKKKEKLKEKERLKKEKERERQKLQREKAQGKIEYRWSMPESKFFPPLEEAHEEYNSLWKDRVEEWRNPFEELNVELMTTHNRTLADIEMRKIVDEMMRLELDLLNKALERDIAKRKKRKGKKKKKKKKKGKRKGKKGKDMTSNRTNESLFEELVLNGIIRPYPEEHVRNFFGDPSFSAWNYRKRGSDVPPALGDVRRLVTEYCILPLGSNYIHQLAPLVKSVCIVGPPQSGQDLLANAVFYETGATLFDLTPENIAGKYGGKGEKKMLCHLVEKMSRILQPSVVFIDGAEKTFYKKVPKPERKLQPKKLQKWLPKFIKKITPEDQVLVLAISSNPFAGKVKKITKTYQKIIFVPPPEYGSSQLYWHKTIMSYHGVKREFDTTSLPKVLPGMALSMIKETVEENMDARRIIRFKYDPLKAEEFLERSWDKPKIEPKTVEKFWNWYSTKTPIGKEKSAKRELEEKMKARNR